jgi:uroporphyrin-3 C-methyltransferase
LIVIREHDQPVQPLLPPEQRYFLTQNLQLQLEQARIALLRGEPEVYSERLQQAQTWVKQFFDQTDSATRSMLDSLQQLAQQNVAPPLPDITSALEELTQYRSGREAARTGATP